MPEVEILCLFLTHRRKVHQSWSCSGTPSFSAHISTCTASLLVCVRYSTILGEWKHLSSARWATTGGGEQTAFRECFFEVGATCWNQPAMSQSYQEFLFCSNFNFFFFVLGGFPGGTSRKIRCQCRKCKRCWFHLWVRKVLWRRAWQHTPVFLSGECHGWRSLVGLQSLASQGVGHDWSDLAYT